MYSSSGTEKNATYLYLTAAGFQGTIYLCKQTWDVAYMYKFVNDLVYLGVEGNILI